MIGTFQKIDLQTDKGLRGQFARFVVHVDLLKPLIVKIRIAKRTHRVEYESLPMICYHCGTYGHLQEDCPETEMMKLWLKKFLVIKRNQVRFFVKVILYNTERQSKRSSVVTNDNFGNNQVDQDLEYSLYRRW
ncbi:hypothetical protein Gotur_030499 [Gossypium turneri]